jgi:DNA-binding transcriptional LysR family regulator
LRNPRVAVAIMDISALEVLSLVVKHGSFAKAAREQNVDPSSISRTIAALEAELDMRLFQRNTRKLALTQAGDVYWQRIEPLLEEIKQAGAAAGDISGRVKGVLRVTASNSFGLKYLAPRIPAFAAKYPELAVDLLLTDSVVDLLAERIDVAIRLGALTGSSLVAQRLMATRYRVVASPAYLRRAGTPKKPIDISAHNCLMFPLPGFNSRWTFRDRQGAGTHVDVSGKLTASSAIVLQQCALAGMGVSLLPGWLIDDELAAGKLVDLFPKYQVTATDFETAAWFVYPSRTYVPQKVRAFMEFFRAG